MRSNTLYSNKYSPVADFPETDCRRSDQTEEFLRAVVNSSRTPIFVKNRAHQLLLVNDALCELVGLSREDIVGKTDAELYDQEEAKGFIEIDERVFQSQQAIEFEETITDASNVTKTLRTIKNIFTTGSGEEFLVGTIYDISELRATQNKLEDAISHLSMVALTDTLTGLSNRKQVEDELSELVNKSRKASTEFTVLFIDLDGFKIINDTVGHEVGDEILKVTAGRLRNLVRSSASVARIGGDEFLILLPKACEQQARHVIDRIVDSFRVPIRIRNNSWPVACSIGAAVYPRDGQTSADLMRNADYAMYEAKKRKTCGSPVSHVEFFQSQISVDVERRIQLETALAACTSEIKQLYQPIVGRNRTGQYVIRGFESLARWIHKGQIVSPTEFIPILERSGDIGQFGYQTIKSACTRIADSCHNGQFVSVNLTYQQILKPDFCSAVRSIINSAGIDPEQLIFELAEQDSNIKVELVQNVFSRLKRIGVKTAIDDFGSGFSNLKRIGSLPLDFVKLDKSVLDDVRILRSLLLLLNDLGYRSIIEGIETESHLQSTEDLEIDLLQGYLFGHPQPAGYDWDSSVLSASFINS